MFSSEIYFKKAKDAIRRGQAEGQSKSQEAIALDIRDTLFQYLSNLPENLRHDIFNFYYDVYLADDDEKKNLYKFAEAPVALIDFMTGQVPSEDVDFSDEEWDLIREGINANADDMDIRLLNQLMAILVEKKRY